MIGDRLPDSSRSQHRSVDRRRDEQRAAIQLRADPMIGDRLLRPSRFPAPTGQDAKIRPSPRRPVLAGNDTVMLKQTAQEGSGIAALPDFLCRAAVRSGALKRVLPD